MLLLMLILGVHGQQREIVSAFTIRTVATACGVLKTDTAD